MDNLDLVFEKLDPHMLRVVMDKAKQVKEKEEETSPGKSNAKQSDIQNGTIEEAAEIYFLAI